MSQMSNPATAKISPKNYREHILGSIEGDPDGPTVVIVTGVHGNESAGVEAAENVFDMLKDVHPEIYGRLIIVKGNLTALEQGMRYINEDMNRLWFPSIIDRIQNTPEEQIDSNERREMKFLLTIFEKILRRSEHPVFLVDVHTFSAEGNMFSITSSEPRQRKLLSKLHVPMVFGIEESLRGTALSYYQRQGFVSFGLEGGNHQNELTKYNITASLILFLQAVGSIEKQYVSKIKEYEEHLKSHTQQLPVETELVYQHIIEPGDEFEMRPGYRNFQPIKEGEWLANDKDGKIVARCDGYILMPLYQSQGDDGFFVIQEHESS